MYKAKAYRNPEFEKVIKGSARLAEATAQEIFDNAKKFYSNYACRDSFERELAFTFASMELGINYDVIYNKWFY